MGDAEDDRGFETKKTKKKDRKPIQSTIKGKFSGWDGKTVFVLENGMIWEQVDKDKFHTREVENPVVTIEPKAFRNWRLSVEGLQFRVSGGAHPIIGLRHQPTPSPESLSINPLSHGLLPIAGPETTGP